LPCAQHCLNDGKLDLTNLTCHFQDLEAIYDAIKVDLICKFCKTVIYFYDLPIVTNAAKDITPITAVPKVQFLLNCNPNYKYSKGTFGDLFEIYYPTLQNARTLDTGVFTRNTMSDYTLAGANISVSYQSPVIGLIYQVIVVAGLLTDDLSTFNFDTFQTEYNKMLTLVKRTSILIENEITNDKQMMDNFKLDDIIDHLSALFYACQSQPYRPNTGSFQAALFPDHPTARAKLDAGTARKKPVQSFARRLRD